MAWIDGAIRKDIAPGSNDPAIDVVGIIFHIAVSESPSLEDFFRHRSGGIESHFYVRRDGTIEQYRSTGFEADANFKANSFIEDGRRKGYLSVETQGMGEGEWTPEQIESCLRIARWAAKVHDFPLTKARSPFTGGVGYHSQFNFVWTPAAKSCPGPDRIKQFDNILIPALRDGKGVDDVSAEEVWDFQVPVQGGKPGQTQRAKWALAQARHRATIANQNARAAARDTDRLRKALAALTEAMPDHVRKGVEAVLNADVDAEVDVSLSLTNDGEGS